MKTALRTAVAPAFVIAFYVWTSASAGKPFAWSRTQGGYYNLLTDGFLAHHLYLNLTPPPELLALRDPFDPTANAPYRANDLSLYRGRYYLYFGPGPAVTLFLPWQWVTGHAMTEDLACLIFITGGYVFALLLLHVLLRGAGIHPPPVLAAAAAVALGMGQYGAIVLRDPAVYGVAVAAGYCFFMAGMFWFARWLRDAAHSPGWGLPAGFLLGLAPACRPHYALAAIVACLIALACLRDRKRSILAFALPLAFCGTLLLWYNAARFGSLFEFGTSYELTARAGTRGVPLRLTNLPGGLYYMLLFPFRIWDQFPYIIPRYVAPAGRFFVENQVGLLVLCPLAAPGLFFPKLRQSIIAVLWGSAVTMLLFISLTGFAVGRYLLDFAPALLVVSLVTWLRWRRVAAIALIAGAAWCTVVSAALSLGFNDFLLRQNPRVFRALAVASGMAPAKIRLPLDGLSLAAMVRFPQAPAAPREALLRTGRPGAQDCLFVEYLDSAGIRIDYVKSAERTQFSPIVPGDPDRDRRLDIWYSASAQRLVISLDGHAVWNIPATFYSTSVDEIIPGEGPTGDRDMRPFSGHLHILPNGVTVYAAGGRETFSYNRE